MCLPCDSRLPRMEGGEGSEEKERGGKKHEIIFRLILYLLALSLSCNVIL